MAKYILKDSKLYVDGYELSGRMTTLGLKRGVEGLDGTVMGQDTRTVMAGGLETVALDFGGFVDHATGSTDEVIDTRLAVANSVITATGSGVTVGTPAYFMRGMAGTYEPGGNVGDAMKFSAAFHGQTNVVRGYVLASGAKTATSNGATVDLGAVGADQYLYGALHVTAVSGTGTPTITVVIKSDADDNWGAGSTERISFTAKTAIGVQWATPVAGPITDTHWRAYWTVSGTNPSLTIAVVAGIR